MRRSRKNKVGISFCVKRRVINKKRRRFEQVSSGEVSTIYFCLDTTFLALDLLQEIWLLTNLVYRVVLMNKTDCEEEMMDL